MKIKHDKLDNEAIALRMIKLAFLASTSMGMGFIHYDPNAQVEDENFKSLIVKSDYDGSSSMYADYIQGRMMKLSIRWDDEGLDISENPCRVDYQSWCEVYPSYDSLYLEAVAELEKELEDAK